ncbi:MAG: hypothetical protein MI806_09975, partial [Minwuiales bacterium]|nr:hypothetical protein [Minwuiales bacterium]
MQRLIHAVWIAAFSSLVALTPAYASKAFRDAATEGDVARYSRDIVLETGARFDKALAYLQIRNEPDVAAAMILALRFNRDSEARISEALS